MRYSLPFLVVIALLAPLPTLRAEGPARVAVPKAILFVDDGDGVVVRWPEGSETVRLLGMDAPEVIHLEHDIPFAQPFGEEARGFVRGCLAASEEVALLRSGQKDPYGRTLGYLFADGRNVSVLTIAASLAVENVGRYGDNGLPDEAKACLEAAKAAGAVPFEDPHLYRLRMRIASRAMRGKGIYPSLPK